MIRRISAIGLAGVVSVGLALIPTETIGRGAGIGGRSFSAHATLRMYGFRAPSHVFPHAVQFRFHQNRFGFGFPLYVRGPFVTGYEPPVFLAPANPPSVVEPDVATGAIPSGRVVSGGAYPVLNYRDGCQTETVRVPLRDGDEKDEVEHSINIVRC
jgi:hypothetical protein